MEYEINTNNFEINFGAKDAEEIIQNVLTLLNTIKGTVPFNRDIGIDGNIIDNAISKKAKLTSQIIDVIEKYEPRCKVISVKIEGDGLNGILIPKVKVKIYDEYL